MPSIHRKVAMLSVITEPLSVVLSVVLDSLFEDEDSLSQGLLLPNLEQFALDIATCQGFVLVNQLVNHVHLFCLYSRLLHSFPSHFWLLSRRGGAKFF